MVEGIQTTAQLRSMGIHASRLRQLLSAGGITRLRRGVYAWDRPSDAIEGHLLLIQATVGEVAPSNVFSHTSAAVLHGLPVGHSELAKATMTRVSGGHTAVARHLKVRNTVLEPDEVQKLHGFRVTTLARTVADQMRTAPLEWGLITADAGLRAGLATEALASALDRHPRLKGITRARTVADLADGRSESPAESLSRLRMWQAGLPMPRLQYELSDDDGCFVARCDYGWPEYRLVGEVDGRIKYDALLRSDQSAADVVMAEKRREERIRALGFWIVRWDWEDAWRGQEMVRRIRAALERA